VGVAIALVVAACAPAAVETTSTTVPSTPTTTTTTTQPTTTVDPRPFYAGFDQSGDTAGTLVALASEGVDVFSEPGSAEPMLVMPKTTILGTTTVLAMVGRPVDGWAEVMLPVRPNGTTGWISVDDVDLYVVDGLIQVDLGDRELVYTVAGEERFRATVAVGTPSNPTPTGRFFVTDRVKVGDASGPWGPNAFGLSARSDTITEFNGGDGIVGIHGTNRPSSIGEAASLGCVRLLNENIARLYTMVPIGTPVEITA
jgi:lipoprotein-anchoring transpeptidase ErfK/SrfK